MRPYGLSILTGSQFLQQAPSHFKMTPAHIFPQLMRNSYEFLACHFMQAVVVDNRSTIGCTASNDIARRRLIAILTADAVC